MRSRTKAPTPVKDILHCIPATAVAHERAYKVHFHTAHKDCMKGQYIWVRQLSDSLDLVLDLVIKRFGSQVQAVFLNSYMRLRRKIL